MLFQCIKTIILICIVPLIIFTLNTRQLTVREMRTINLSKFLHKIIKSSKNICLHQRGLNEYDYNLVKVSNKSPCAHQFSITAALTVIPATMQITRLY